MQYYEPNFIDEALVLLDRFGTNAHVLAGGTRLRFALRRGVAADAALINLKRIADLGRIEDTASDLWIGPLVTAAALRRHVLVGKHAPLLATTAASLGAAQLQTVATIGGNIVSADPAADLVPALIAYSADAEILSAGDCARIATVEDIVSKRPALQGRELLGRIRVPIAPHRASYQKMTTRRGLEMALVSVAVSCRMGGAVVADARVALAGAAPSVVRARGAERALIGSRLSSEVAQAAGERAAADADPLTDARASAAYRRALVATLTQRAVMEL
ncbi:MAG: FAD binding domain-containing protein [Candidatus Eremiobacteraeota bacterium]|nr:FAD binding domain-containing protein [Candidatus Eremiobacteraeota bacterium]